MIDVLETCDMLGMYDCGQSDCVPMTAVCNGLIDCPYGVDEIGCPTTTTTIGTTPPGIH